MSLNESDAALLWDLLRAAREVESFVDHVTEQDYLNDLMRQRAVERCIEIIGEAARGLSEAFREAHPDIEWKAIIATRHILAHEYAAVMPERVWRIATVHVPPLEARVDAILSAGSSS